MKQSKDKTFYREYFALCKPYIKLNSFCKMCGISQSSLSKFINDPNQAYVLSLESLEKLYIVIQAYLKTIA